MKAYKVVSVSQKFKNSKLAEKATNILNEYSEIGWDLEKIKHGWNNWLSSTLYIVLSRNKEN